MDHAQRKLGEAHAHPVEVDRVLHLAGDRRARDPGVHAQRQVEFGTLGVQRVVDRVGGRVLAVTPEAGSHRNVGHRQVVDDRGQLPQRSNRTQQVHRTHRQREPIRLGLNEFACGGRRFGEAVHQDRLGDALLVHLVDEFGQLDGREHGLRALEIVVAHLEHPGGLNFGFAEVHVHQAVDHPVGHVVGHVVGHANVSCCVATLLAQR